MKTFTIRELTKRGFERRSDLDFRDDGTAFKCLMYKGFRVTYTKSEDTYFLSIDIDCKETNFTWNDAFNTDWYKLADEFNGVEEIDVEKFISNFDKIEEGMKELNEKFASYQPNIKAIQEFAKKEIEEAEKAVIFFKTNYDWYNVDSMVSLKWDIEKAKSLERAIQNAKKVDFTKYSIRELREIEQRIEQYNSTGMGLSTNLLMDATKKHMVK